MKTTSLILSVVLLSSNAFASSASAKFFASFAGSSKKLALATVNMEQVANVAEYSCADLFKADLELQIEVGNLIAQNALAGKIAEQATTSAEDKATLVQFIEANNKSIAQANETQGKVTVIMNACIKTDVQVQIDNAVKSCKDAFADTLGHANEIGIIKFAAEMTVKSISSANLSDADKEKALKTLEIQANKDGEPHVTFISGYTKACINLDTKLGGQ